MSSSAALLQFAAEFVVFLAASAGVGSVLAGADGDGGRRSLSRAAAATGFVALAVSAVVRGSDVAGGSDTAQVVGLRAAGVVLLFLESVRSPLRRPARIALWAGLALLVAAGGADVADEATATGVMLAVGGAVVGLSVVLAGQRSIATRVSTSAAGIVLVVVLILGLSLSVVLVSTVQDGVVERLERRAGNEAANAQAAATQLAGAARVVSGSLGGALIDTVARLADQQVASDRLAEPLATLSENFLENASLAFVSRRGAAQGAVNFTTAELVSLSGSDVVREALTTGDTRNAVEVVAGSAQAIRVQPVPLGGRPPLLGVAVAAIPLDRTYLERAARDDRDLALALVTPERTLSSFGPTVAPVLFRAMVAQALERGVMSGTVGDRFVSVAPVDRGDGTSAVALVASYPTTLVADTRDELFRVLFLIALAGTVIALTLASLVGSRIGSRLQLLTEAARSIRRGDPVPRTGITTDDEVGVLSVTFDAMARAVAEKTAAESALRNRLEAVVAGMGEALVVVDAAGMVTDFNPAAEELFGLMASDAAGRPVDEVVHLTDDDGRSLVYDLRAPDRWSARGMVETVDGVRVPVAISVGTLGLGVLGRGGRVVNLRDLRGEQQVERMKTELLARFSHEYRTPLTPIMGYGKQLAAGPIPADTVRMWGSTIFDKAKVIERIIKMQEFFARLAGGGLEVSKEWVDPGTLVDEAVKRSRRRLTRAGHVTRRVDRRLPSTYVDRGLLGDCLDEFLDNADKYSPPGGRIVVEAGSGAGGSVVLSVTDHGIGMTDEDQAAAFVRFGQGDQSDTRSRGGLGLGLAFVQEVVEAHGGRVLCESSPGSGSKLSIVLSVPPRDGQR